MRSFSINNKKFNYDLEKKIPDITLLEYLESIGISVPHYCYERRLSISGNCRMCLVELKGSPKPVVSCSTSARTCLGNNNEIYTDSPLVKKARETVLEFLLLNHPLDCPICDQGGECDLQDQAFFYGSTKKRFYDYKRVVSNKNLGPVVKTVMTRCIHCTRCVRFAEEIAGVGDIGMFGRGSKSEIGTYVDKTFQSELSGNVIDLCPVGALTSKPYSFVKRNWELKNINYIDSSDGLASNVQLSLKNNKIVKVQPGFNNSLQDSNWITDKARFSFEGMFSSERSIEGYIENSTDKSVVKLSWKELLNEIVSILYFQDSLSSYSYNTSTLLIVIDNNISLESLNMLLLLSKRYSFIKLRKSEGNSLNLDQETNFLVSSNFDNELDSTNLCVLIGVNTRYEGSNLNLKLRERYKKGNFKVVSIGSIVDLTFPVLYEGLTLQVLESFVLGTNKLCQEFVNRSNPIFIVSSEVYKRKDIKGILKLFLILRRHMIRFYKKWNNIHFLNSSVNEAGVNYLKNIELLDEKDLSNNFGIYFVNISNKDNINKMINLKMLNYYPEKSGLPKVILEQNSGLDKSRFNSFYKTSSNFSLPNSNFYESKGSYLNTEGRFNTTIKVVESPSLVKEDWQIFRKLLMSSKKINYINNFRDNNLIHYNSRSYNMYQNYIGFLYYPSVSLSKSNRYFERLKINSSYFVEKNNFKISKTKINNTKFKIWLSDFYIGGHDLYSSYSLTLVKCSKLYRNNVTNFPYLI